MNKQSRQMASIHFFSLAFSVFFLFLLLSPSRALFLSRTKLLDVILTMSAEQMKLFGLLPAMLRINDTIKGMAGNLSTHKTEK